MKRSESLLDNLEIAAPCKANWNEMVGDERTRHCQSCQLNVYNISDMTRTEAEDFLQSRKDSTRTCVRFFRRHDGTILTDNCPRGLRALRDAGRRTWRYVASLVWLMLSTTVAQAQSQETKGDWAPANNSNVQDPRWNAGGFTLTSPIPAPNIPQIKPGIDVSAKVVLPETWAQDHRKATESAIWAVNSASLSWHVNAGMLRSATELFSKQIKHCTLLNHKREAAVSHNNRGNCFYYEGKFAQAIQEYETALKLLEEPMFAGKQILQAGIVANIKQAKSFVSLNNHQIGELLAKPMTTSGNSKLIWLIDCSSNTKETKGFQG